MSAVLVALVLWVGAPASAGAAPHSTTTGSGTAKSPCRPATPATAAATTSYYDAARTWLGPNPLPSVRPVGPLLPGYRRFGALTETQFVAKYRSADGWIYPPNDGFLTVGGTPLKTAWSLLPGGRIDRFGYPGGAYLAPAYTPFTQRALPPQNLNTPTGTPQSNYHLYCVLKTFTVDGGPIAPWFGQLGLGLQYKLESRYLPDAGTALSVTWLLQNGYLVEERPWGAGYPSGVNRHSLRDALLAAGLPPESFQLAGVHEAAERPTDFWFLRPAAGGGWELGSYERGRFEVRETHPSETEAALRLHDILIPPANG